MSVSIEVSYGELVDKITILRIKQAKFSDPAKRANVERELQSLEDVWLGLAKTDTDIAQWISELTTVNERLWDIEDRLRSLEAAGRFANEFIELARQVYITNDRRALLKRLINETLGSEIVEEKEYVEY